jgi:asparagine N-glycosylation enzyme membrane subunit Stt3
MKKFITWFASVMLVVVAGVGLCKVKDYSFVMFLGSLAGMVLFVLVWLALHFD